MLSLAFSGSGLCLLSNPRVSGQCTSPSGSELGMNSSDPETCFVRKNYYSSARKEENYPRTHNTPNCFWNDVAYIKEESQVLHAWCLCGTCYRLSIIQHFVLEIGFNHLVKLGSIWVNLLNGLVQTHVTNIVIMLEYWAIYIEWNSSPGNIEVFLIIGKGLKSQGYWNIIILIKW